MVCDVSRVLRPHLGTIDRLARLQLAATRRGERICLRGACPELVQLISFAGMAELLPVEARLSLEAGGQAEQREEPGGVQEEGDAADLAT